MRYGIPFQGSKSKLAEKIVAVLPRATHLYDVFAGGCAVSHAALLSGKWKCVHFSDISNSVELFRDCLEGNIPDGSEWISREEFFRRREEPHIRLLWSFGNDGRTYLYSKELEPYKKAVHEMIYAPTPNERRLKFREVCKLIPYVLSLKENGGGRTLCDHASMERSARLCTVFSTSNLSYPPQSVGNQKVTRPAIKRGAPEVLYRLEPMERICGGVNQSNSTACSTRKGGGHALRPFAVGSMKCG